MTYSLQSSRLARDGNVLLSRGHIAELAKSVTRRRLRAHGIRPMRELDDFGSFSYRFAVVRAVKKNDNNWARLRAYELFRGSFEAYLDGPRALEALERLNEALTPKNLAQRERLKKMRRIVAKRHQRALEKQQKREAERQARRELNRRPAPKKKPRDRFLELFVKNNVKPQLKHHVVTWRDVPYATAWIFEVNSTIYRTASQRAESRLYDTLEHSDGRFATRTKDGFTIRFEVVGKWRGDLTEIRIAFTDDNKHPLHRRARKYFKQLLIGAAQKRERILRPRASDTIKIAA